MLKDFEVEPQSDRLFTFMITSKSHDHDQRKRHLEESRSTYNVITNGWEYQETNQFNQRRKWNSRSSLEY